MLGVKELRQPHTTGCSLRLLAWCWFAGLACSSSASATPQDWADLLNLDHAHGRPWPAVSSFEKELNEAGAYAIQRALVADQSLLGYRAAFVSPLVQQQLRIAQPGLGAVLSKQHLGKRPHLVYMREHQRFMLEAGIAFRLKSNLLAGVTTAEDLRDRLDALVPVLVVADQAFSMDAMPKLIDYVAINLGTIAIATGVPVPFKTDSLPELKLALSREGRQVLWGRSQELGPSPLETVRWMINQARRSGYRLHPGTLLYAGAWGRQLPALPGRYIAKFEGVGEVDIEIRNGDRLKAKPVKRPVKPAAKPALHRSPPP